jgi:hypothetical protein
MGAKEVWPQQNGQNPLPEGEVEEPYGEKPGRKPQCPHKTMLLDFDLFHARHYTPWRGARDVKLARD